MKQCPFCGFADVVSDSFKDEWFVRCRKCDAIGPSKDSEANAIEKWNRADRPAFTCCQGEPQCGRCPMRSFDQKAQAI